MAGIEVDPLEAMTSRSMGCWSLMEPNPPARQICSVGLMHEGYRTVFGIGNCCIKKVNRLS